MYYLDLQNPAVSVPASEKVGGLEHRLTTNPSLPRAVHPRGQAGRLHSPRITIHHRDRSSHRVSSTHRGKRKPSIPTGLQPKAGEAAPSPCAAMRQGTDLFHCAKGTRPLAAYAEAALVGSHRATYKIYNMDSCHWHAGLADLSKIFA